MSIVSLVTGNVFGAALLLGTMCLASCANAGSEDSKMPTGVYEERYRPQFHFTPKKNWMNDPNGLVFYGGEYHLKTGLELYTKGAKSLIRSLKIRKLRSAWEGTR